METKLLQIFQLCLEIISQGQYNILQSYGSGSQVMDVSIYDGVVDKKNLVCIYKVFVSMKENRADEVIKKLEQFKQPVLCKM